MSNATNLIEKSDTPAAIATKWLNGHLPEVSATEAMAAIKDRGFRMEGRLDEARAEINRLRVRK